MTKKKITIIVIYLIVMSSFCFMIDKQVGWKSDLNAIY